MTRQMSARAHATLLAALTGVPACSLLSIETVPAGYREMRQVRCTSNNVAPGLDTLGAIGSTGGAVVTGVVKMSPAVIAANVIGAAAYLGSAAYGFSNTAKCRVAIDAVNEVHSAPEPTAPTEGITLTRDRITRRASLRLALGNGAYRLMLSGDPERKPERFVIGVARHSKTPAYESCRSLQLLMNGTTIVLSASAAFFRGATDTRGQSEALSAPITRETIEGVANADDAAIRPCKERIALRARDRAWFSTFLKRWKQIADSSAPTLPTEVQATAQQAPPEHPPDTPDEVTLPVVDGQPGPPATQDHGCEYDAQCKGERLCIEGQCLDRPASDASAPSGTTR